MHPILVSERISVVYADKGILEQDGHQLVLTDQATSLVIPVGKTTNLRPSAPSITGLVCNANLKATLPVWVVVKGR